MTEGAPVAGGQEESARPWVPPGDTAPPSAPPLPPAPSWGPPPAPPTWGPPPSPWGPPPPPPGWGRPLPPLPKGGSSRTGPLPLHPMTVGDILDGAFKLMKANARAVFTVVAVFVVPLQLAAAYAQRSLLGGAGLLDVLNDPSLQDPGRTAQPLRDQLVGLVASLLNLLVLPFLAGAISQVVGASYLGEELGAGAALARMARRAWALFASWVLVHVLELGIVAVAGALFVGGIVLGGGVAVAAALLGIIALLTGVPVLLAVLALSVAVAPAVVVEELGPVAGVRRSWSLMRRRFWPVLGIALLAGFLSSILGNVLGFVPSTAGLLVGLRWGWVLVAAGAILTALVTQPIVAVVATLQYFDARIRFEGFDLQVIAAELGPTPSTAPVRGPA